MSFYNVPKLKALIAASALIGSSVAQAQLEEILVTAQKRSESLLDVPIAVTAHTGETLETLGVTNASQLVDITPGLASATQQGSNRNYFLRGVGTRDVHVTAASAIGQYYDGVTLTSGFHAKAALFDMERVEILKGPQNTLFGLNTTGGAINYISKKPEIGGGTFGNANLKLGSNSHVELDAAVSFDMSETVSGRIAIQSISDDGAFLSTSNGERYGDDDTQAIRATFLWEPSDNSSVTFNVHGFTSKNNSTAVKAVGSRAADGVTICADAPTSGIIDFSVDTNCYSRNGGATGEPATDPSTSDWTLTAQDFGSEDLDSKGAYLKFDYDFAGVAFNSITSWDNLEFKNTNDNDGGDTLGLQTYHSDDRDTFQQEFRLVSTGDGAFRWIAGIYYLKDEAFSYTGLRAARGGPFGAGLRIPNVQLDHSKENASVYFQGEYDISDAVTLTAGIRRSDEEIIGHYLPSSPNVAGDPTPTVYFSDDITALVAAQNPGTAAFDSRGFEIGRQITQNLNNKDTGYTIKLDWKLGDDSLVYLSNSRGFKGSALDTRPVFALVPVANVLASLEEDQLSPESLDAWEIGYKSSFMDNRVQFDAAAFSYTYENLQQFVTSGGIPSLVNAKESEITGLDANIKYASDNGFYLQAGVSFLDTEVTDGTNSDFVEGSELAHSPDISFNILAAQDYELSNGNSLTLTANLTHTGEQVAVTATTGNLPVLEQYTIDAYTLLSANLNYRFGDNEKYNFSVYGNNLTDEHFCGAVLINDNGALVAPTLSPAGGGPLHLNAMCRVSNASTRTVGVSFGMDF